MEDNYPATETFGPIPAQELSAQLLLENALERDVDIAELYEQITNLNKALQGELEAHNNTAVKLARTEASYESILRPLIDAVMESQAFSTMIDSRVAKVLEVYTESDKFVDSVQYVIDQNFDIDQSVEDAIDNLEFTVEVNNSGRGYRSRR